MSDPSDSELMLLCKAGSRVCAIAASEVRETMRPLGVEKVAGMPPFMAGVAMVRGTATPVLDAHFMLTGREPTDRAARWVLLESADRRLALAVSTVLGLERLTGRARSAALPLVEAGPSGILDGVAARDATLLFLLRSVRVLPDALWEQLSALARGRSPNGSLAS